MSTEATFDIVAVNLETHAERVMARGLTKRNAEAYIDMAVLRRGVDAEFYKAVPSVAQPNEGAEA